MEQINKKAIQIASQKLHISEDEAARNCERLEMCDDAYRVTTDEISGPFALIDVETGYAIFGNSIDDYRSALRAFIKIQVEKKNQANSNVEKTNVKNKDIPIGLIVIVVIIAIMALPALGVMWLWNSFIVDMFSVEPISFWIAWLISAVLGTIFGGFSFTIKHK